MNESDVKIKAKSKNKDVISFIRSEHARWLKEMGQDDPYTSDVTIGIKEVLEAHFLLAEFFAEVGEGIGGIGPKDPKMLISALGRQFTGFGGGR